jgi:hypothetical protein
MPNADAACSLGHRLIVQHLQLLDIYELPTTYFLLTSLGLAS